MNGEPIKVPDELVAQLVRGEVILFIGEQLAIANESERGFPSLATMVSELKARCDYPDEDPQSFPIVAGYYDLVKGPNALVQYIIDCFDDPTLPPNKAHRLAASLPCSLIVTTSYGKMFERALELPPIQPYFTIVDDTDIPFYDPGKKVVVRLLGSFDRPDSLVITDKDFSALLYRLPTLNVFILSQIATRTLLFLGYDIQSEFFRHFYDSAVLHSIARHKRRAYAVIDSPSPVTAALWANRNLITIARDPTEFLEALVQAITQYHGPEKKKSIVRNLPDTPYKFLDWFKKEDAGVFFGRDAEAAHLVRQVETQKLTVLVGQSGVGKTSLLNAGVMPRLEDTGYQTLYVRALTDPGEIIKRELWKRFEGENLPISPQAKLMSLKRFLEASLPSGTLFVIIIDQFEEFFMRLGEASRRDFALNIVECMNSSTHDLRFLLSLREDYLYRLLEMEPPIKGIFTNRFWLRNLDESRAKEAIVEPVKEFGLSYEDKLLSILLRDLETGGVDPSQLQIVCHRLYQALGESKKFTLDTYQELGGTASILANYLAEVIERFESEEDKEAVRAILKSMVTAEQTKAALSIKEVTRDALVRRLELEEGQVTSLLKELQDRRIVRRLPDEDDVYELAHEVLVEKVWEWIDDEDITYKYVRQMLRQALADWRQLRVLPGREKWVLLNNHRQTLDPTLEEATLMLHAALDSGLEIEYWIEQAQKGGLNMGDEVKSILQGERPQTMQSTLSWLSNQNDIDALPFLKFALDSPYPAVQRQARRLLKDLGTSDASAILAKNPAPDEAVLIPAGWFIMGSDVGRFEDEKPSHRVWLDDFYILRFPVTNIEYQQFLTATEHIPPAYWEAGKIPPGKEDHPVVGVSWHDAVKYCKWLSTVTEIPYRLPTEAEWEKSASWDEELRVKRVWAWGDNYESTKGNTRIGGPGDTTPVGQYSVADGDSPYGLSDMSGNTFDWIADWWNQDYYKDSPTHNPKGPDHGVNKVTRGGSWAGSSEGASTISRYYSLRPDLHNEYTGFRLAYDPVEGINPK